MKRLLYGLAVGALVALAAAGALLTPRAAAEEQPAEPEPAREVDERTGLVKITPEMVRYSHTRYALYFLGALWEAAALVVILRTRASSRLRELAERRGRNGLVRSFIYYPLLMIAYGALMLPLAFYSGFLLPHQYGLSNQSLGGYLADGAKGWAISAAVGSPVVALLYWMVRRSPRRWWLGFWVALIPMLVLTILLAPLVIAPLFNRFQPLRDEALREKILALARRAGIEEGRVFEVDASRRTKALNAYVTGLGGSARIVLWDTLLERLEEDEILFVMAHEMGHYVERHVPLLLLVSIAGSFVVLLATDRSARALIARHGERWGVRGLDDIASLPVLLLIVGIINFLGSPVESALSRAIERRADTFGLRLTQDGEAAASSFVKLSELNLSHPSPPPFVEFWMFSHPPLNERIRRALAWRSESDAAPAAPAGDGERGG